MLWLAPQCHGHLTTCVPAAAHLEDCVVTEALLALIVRQHLIREPSVQKSCWLTTLSCWLTICVVCCLLHLALADLLWHAGSASASAHPQWRRDQPRPGQPDGGGQQQRPQRAVQGGGTAVDACVRANTAAGALVVPLSLTHTLSFSLVLALFLVKE